MPPVLLWAVNPSKPKVRLMNSVANQTWRWWLEWLPCLYLQVTVLKKHKQHKWATSQNSQVRARTQDLFYRSSVPLIVLHKHTLQMQSGSYSLLRDSRWVRVYFNSLSWVAISFNRVPHFTSGLLPLWRRSATCTNFPRLATTLGDLGQRLAI